MRASLVAILAALVSQTATARIVVDSAGRKVDVPETVNRVYAAGPPASVLIYVLAPDKLTGWPRAPHPYERPYLAAPYRDLPETGRLTGKGDTANLEVVLKDRPDLIVDFGSVRGTYVSLAESVQEQTGIPYVLIDGHFEATPAALRLMGELLGVRERAETLARYVEALFQEIDTRLENVAEEDRPRVYLARGPEGLETGLKGSINTEIIERAGGRNVADPGAGSIRRGIVDVSIEQVIVANPDTIITWDPQFYHSVWSNPLWSGIQAVAENRIWLSPAAPFGWIDRPPSLNRIIGLKWLTGLFFPDLFTFDLAEETRKFYKLFYHVDLTDDELAQLIQWASGDPDF